jgi:4-hydroxy 2-oxovalerate aldolase
VVQGRYICRGEGPSTASAYGIDTRSILVELGKRKMVGGQEDMIVDVELEMVVRSSG